MIYNQSAWNLLADALAADASPCANYYLSLPAVGDPKTDPRGGGEAARMRGRGPRFHALAEFHWTSWHGVTGMTWYQRGVEFRRRMADAGYDLAAGDTWAINELPSSVRSDPTVRAQVRNLVRGLYDGPAGSAHTRGVVFTIGMGQETTYLTTYKTNLRNWLSDDAFWSDMNAYARFWAQEVYADPSFVCTPGTTTGDRSQHINAFVEHVARMAAAGPAASATAQSYMNRSYTPLMNAVWRSAASGYGDTMIPLAQMQHHVSGQVYAARAWSNTHLYPDGRLGFAWARTTGTLDADLSILAARLASAIHYAYDTGGGSAAAACSPTGALTWCQCNVSGARFNEGWETLATW